MARVLVIDDDEMTRRLVSRMLAGLAFQEAFGKVTVGMNALLETA